jgi:hypothetical protein
MGHAADTDSASKRKRQHEWKIEKASPDDAPRLASLQVAAFKSNTLFEIQFPTNEVVKSYEIYLSARIRAEIETPHSNVLAIKGDSGEIVSFAIWRAPNVKEDKNLNAKKTWPMGTNLDLIQRWADKVNEAYRAAVGERSCYRESRSARCSIVFVNLIFKVWTGLSLRQNAKDRAQVSHCWNGVLRKLEKNRCRYIWRARLNR